ncbi:MAG TPA: hypothetical protein VFA66_02130 [Gaiellaceae bacterium]|nr:hypothetical protein [Gaiellaceae bacterium]
MRQPPLVLIHIPKTAGSAFRRLISRRYPGRFRNAPNTFTHPQVAAERLREMMQAEPPPLALGGHIVFGLRDVLPSEAAYMTILRDPVERTLSHYGYLVAPRDPVERPHGLLARDTPYNPDLTLAEALADPRYLPDNLQTRMLVAHRSPFEPLPPDALEQAKEHLRSRFAFVGVTERLDELSALLTVALGWRSRLPRRTRVGEARPRRTSLEPEAIAAVEAQNALDLELYRLAVELQEQAVEPHADEVRLELDVLERARHLREVGRKNAEPAKGDLRARLVDTRARILLEDERADRLAKRLAREGG